MLTVLFLRYLHLSQFFFTFLTKSLLCIVYPSFKTYLHTVSTPECLLYLSASGFHLRHSMLELNACKSLVHKRCLRINLSLQLTFQNFNLSFLLLLFLLCSTEYYLFEVKSSDIHFL